MLYGGLGLVSVPVSGSVQPPSPKKIMRRAFDRRTVGSYGKTAADARQMFRRMTGSFSCGVVRSNGGYVAFA